ncbi:MAG: cytochrome C oxidase subunit IV family protein [Bacteroidota bacterium]
MSEGHHKTPWKTLYAVFAALVVLTGVTYVTAAHMDFGILDVPLAIAIASTKAALVVLFFMAVKYDKPVNGMIFVVGTLFVIVFIGITLLDTTFRGLFEPDEAITIMDRANMEADLVRRDSLARPAFEAQPLTIPADTVRFPELQTVPRTIE